MDLLQKQTAQRQDLHWMPENRDVCKNLNMIAFEGGFWTGTNSTHLFAQAHSKDSSGVLGTEENVFM